MEKLEGCYQWRT